MPKKIFWTQENINYIKANLHLFNDAKLGVHFGVSVSAIKKLRLINNIIRQPKRYYSAEDDQIIRELYSDTKTEIIAEKLNRSIIAIYGHASILGLKKSQEFLKTPECGILYPGHTRGINTQFKKGHITWNKGKKMSSELKERIKHTFFQKGHKPGNTKYNGYISTRTDKRTGITYQVIRVSERKFEHLHRYIWKIENGPIPKGFNLVFKNGNTFDCNISNLELISNAELLNRNSIHNYPEDLRNLILAKGALNRQINEISKNG